MLQEHNTGLRQKKLFSTTISGYPAGYPVICRIYGQCRISGQTLELDRDDFMIKGGDTGSEKLIHSSLFPKISLECI